MEMMRNEIDKPNNELFVTALQQVEKVELQHGVFKGQEATLEHVSNQKAHLYLPSLGIKLVINKLSL